MKRNALILTTIALLGATPMAALAQEANESANSATEAQMFASAKVSLQQATDLALTTVPGTLSAIGFNAENGVGVYEATIIAADGTSSIVKIDANTGAILASGQSALMGDEEGGNDNGMENQSQNETENGADNESGGENQDGAGENG